MVNYLAILVASIAAMALGFVWYSPKVFGTMWMKLSGTKENKDGMAWRASVGLLSTIVQAYVLAIILGYAGATTMGASISVALLAWLGFTGTVTLGGFLWERQPFSLWVLNNAHNAIAVVIMAAILTAWV